MMGGRAWEHPMRALIHPPVCDTIADAQHRNLRVRRESCRKTARAAEARIVLPIFSRTSHGR